MENIAVFCGSSSGNDPIYTQAAKDLAKAMARRNCNLIYGGGSVGLMGVIADEMLALGKDVIGIIPKKIYEWEVGHTGITRLEVVNDMHERKARMAELSDAFIAMPGGIGTLEEIIEAFTWLQIGYHHKPCALLNVNGYYDTLINFMDKMEADGFLRTENRSQLITSQQSEELMKKIINNSN